MINKFSYVMDIGEQMLISGAEVHRVEESISRMCYALGASRVDVFIITSSMVVTVRTQDGQDHTQTRRITAINTNIERLHLLNGLCRNICKNGFDEEKVSEALERAVNCPAYSRWVELICYAVIAAAFTLFFGGGVADAAVSAIVGIIVACSVFLGNKVIPNKIFGKFLSSAVSTLAAFCALRFGWISTVDSVIIGNIMTLIPGIGLTTAIRDLFTGDSIAGILRSVEAVLTALAIAAGYFLVAFLGGYAL